MAFRWAIAFGAVGLLVLATKVAFVAWGIGSARLDFTGVSGHSALASVFWPVMGWLVTQKCSPSTRRPAITLGVALAFAIGISRLALEVHSVSEVVSGMVVGLIASGWFLRGVRPRPTATPVMVALIAIFCAMVLLGHGKPAPTTALIETTVVRVLKVHTPFTRRDLHLNRL
jgi:membrane-associated phospholipid phosphatase